MTEPGYQQRMAEALDVWISAMEGKPVASDLLFIAADRLEEAAWTLRAEAKRRTPRAKKRGER